MSVERFKTNPFLEGMIIPVKGKQVRLSKLGREDNVLINQSTGEVHGTHVTTYKSVDSEQLRMRLPLTRSCWMISWKHTKTGNRR
jgi:hypothetical protein